MSLKHFHVFFIATVLGLMTYMGFWATQRTLEGWSHRGTMALAAAGFVSGLVYLGWFLRRYRTLQ